MNKYIHIMYGPSNSGKTSTAKELEGEYIDFKTHSLYFDYPTIKVLPDKGLIIDGGIWTNLQLNLLLIKLKDHSGIDKYIEKDGTYRIIIYYFDRDVDDNKVDIEYPSPQLPIQGIRDKELREEIDNRPRWLKEVYKLRRTYGKEVAYLNKISSTKPYLFGYDSNFDDINPFFELTDMLVKINPSMPISVYKEMEKHIRGDVKVQRSYYDDYAVEGEWRINLEDISYLIPEWNND